MIYAFKMQTLASWIPDALSRQINDGFARKFRTEISRQQLAKSITTLKLFSREIWPILVSLLSRNRFSCVIASLKRSYLTPKILKYIIFVIYGYKLHH
jgi:hypothetical protein